MLDHTINDSGNEPTLNCVNRNDSDHNPVVAKPVAVLLDEAAQTLRRPLALVNDHAYAAAWLPVRVPDTEPSDGKDHATHNNLSGTHEEQWRFIIRDDGLLYADHPVQGAHPLTELGLEVNLPEIPPQQRLWSSRGVQAYIAGRRPEPAGVFHRMVGVVNWYIDFDRSLTSQERMAELIACYILATWFLDAFSVIGYLWPNGDRGCGKTQLLKVVTELGYLGQLILAGGSFASIRDMADYGACMGFDDAENLSSARTSDADKRALLLAGNRRGSTVPVKEPKGNGQTGWRTRHVNTFCPRTFSATQLPDPILASRTITIPLVRSADRSRANADPLDYTLWPCNRQELIDDQWALALCYLTELPAYEAQIGQQASLSGRNLEPWKAILAVAAWLEDHGVPGLYARIEQLSRDYQRERPEFETADLTTLVVRALLNAVNAIYAVNAVSKGSIREVKFTTADIMRHTIEVASNMEIDISPDSINVYTVGRMMSKLRFKPNRTEKRKGWRVPLADLVRLATTYSVPLPEGWAPLATPTNSARSAMNTAYREYTNTGSKMPLLMGNLSVIQNVDDPASVNQQI